MHGAATHQPHLTIALRQVPSQAWHIGQRTKWIVGVTGGAERRHVSHDHVIAQRHAGTCDQIAGRFRNQGERHQVTSCGSCGNAGIGSTSRKVNRQRHDCDEHDELRAAQ